MNETYINMTKMSLPNDNSKAIYDIKSSYFMY